MNHFWNLILELLLSQKLFVLEVKLPKNNLKLLQDCLRNPYFYFYPCILNYMTYYICNLICFLRFRSNLILEKVCNPYPNPERAFTLKIIIMIPGSIVGCIRLLYRQKLILLFVIKYPTNQVVEKSLVATWAINVFNSKLQKRSCDCPFWF